MVKVYLDTCCLNRPFDDESQDRIRLEAEAIRIIFAHIQAGDWEWVVSDAVTFEVEQSADSLRRERVQSLLAHAQIVIAGEEKEQQRMLALIGLGFRPLDALHVACAESGAADVLLTTDDRFQ
jgi:predicted nucleic acid-binding protein